MWLSATAAGCKLAAQCQKVAVTASIAAMQSHYTCYYSVCCCSTTRTHGLFMAPLRKHAAPQRLHTTADALGCILMM
eukprot:4966-Heterococcus_DN1.PRE.1